MANKRIKISELPKVTFNPSAGVLETTLSDENYLPIAVTDRTNAAIKTSMAVTTRELQRYVLQQPADFTDDSNELTLARTGITVKTPTLSSTNFVTLTATVNNLSVTTFETSTFKVNGDITVGTSTYPAVLRRKGQPSGEENLIIVSGPFGIIDSEPGKTLAEFVSNNIVTGSGNVGKIVTVGSGSGGGTFSFDQDLRTLLRSANSIESAPVGTGSEVLAVGTNGSIVPASTLNATYSVVKVENLYNAIKATGSQFTNATSTDQKLLVTTDTSPTLSGDGTTSDIQVASTNHMKLTTVVDDLNDAVNYSNTGETRLIANSPLVLAAKFENGQDLTTNSISKDIPAQIGELRWNIYNGVPTLYMAVSADNASAGRVDKAKIWYGIPLFGDLSTATITGNTDDG